MDSEQITTVIFLAFLAIGFCIGTLFGLNIASHCKKKKEKTTSPPIKRNRE